MNNWETILKIELPIALPVIMSGIRFATVYLIGWLRLPHLLEAGVLGTLFLTG